MLRESSSNYIFTDVLQQFLYVLACGGVRDEAAVHQMSTDCRNCKSLLKIADKHKLLRNRNGRLVFQFHKEIFRPEFCGVYVSAVRRNA
jgi:hypothetical protein